MIKLGIYVNTHGILGEIRILSNFSRKDIVFVPGFKIYIDDREFIIKSYRKHKNYDMVMLEGINNINDIIDLKGSTVYINRNDIDSFIDEDLTYYRVSCCNVLYDIKDVLNNKMQKILVLSNDKLIPYVDDFILKKDFDNKIIYMDIPKDLL